jgi:hypothetical protein
MRHCLGFELLFEIMIIETACTAIDVYVCSDVGVGYECCEDANMVAESCWSDWLKVRKGSILIDEELSLLVCFISI